MEGVGARLGRSSTRYGPATVFNGPVRKWKKRWVHVSPSATTSNNNNHSQTHHHHLRNTTSNGTTASTTNRNNSSHLFLYKWTPLIQKESNGDNDMISDKDEAEAAAAPEDPPRRKFKYIPIVLLEEERKEAEENEAAEQVDTETKPSDGGVIDVESTRKNNGFDEKPDINDIPIEEIQSPGNNQIVRQDLNESTLDLSLGLSARDNDSDSKSDQNKNEQLERVNT